MTYYRVVVQVYGAQTHAPSRSDAWELLGQFGVGGDNQPVQSPTLVEAMDNIEALIAIQWQRFRENAPIVDMAPPITPQELARAEELIKWVEDGMHGDHDTVDGEVIETKAQPQLPTAGTVGWDATPNYDGHDVKCDHCAQPVVQMEDPPLWVHVQTNEVRCDPRQVWATGLSNMG